MILSFTRSYLLRNKIEILHFIAVGFTTGFILMGLFYCFFNILKFSDGLATSYAYVVTAFIHFIFNRNLTFKAQSGSITNQSIRYFAMLLINYALMLVGLFFITDILLLPPYINIIFSIFTNAASSYLIMKFFVFSSKK